MKNPDVSVVMPAYNEGKVLGQVIQDVLQYFGNVICVDDGSTDDSATIISNTQAKLVRHPINLGAGAAMQTGVEYALLDKNIRYVITIDADGQHDIRDAVKMLEHLKKQDLDATIGSRFLGRVENISKMKWFFLQAARYFSRLDSGVSLTDPHNGLQVYSRKFAESLELTLPDFSHKSEIIQRIREGDFKYDEYPVTVTYTDYSKSKGQPMLNAINISFDLFLHRIAKR